MAAVPLGLAGILPIVLACAGTGLVLAFPRRPPPPASSPTPSRSASASSATRAYLWHQPLLAFARIRFGHLDPLRPPRPRRPRPPPRLADLGFVETPFRRPGGASPRPAAHSPPFHHRGPRRPRRRRHAHRRPRLRAPRPRSGDHGRRSPTPTRGATPARPTSSRPTRPIRVPGCLLDGARPAVAFWGDSHADALQGALFPAAKAAGFRFYSVTRSACPPVPGLTRTGPAASPACDAFVRDVDDYAAARRRRGRRHRRPLDLGRRRRRLRQRRGRRRGRARRLPDPDRRGARPATPTAQAAVIATYVARRPRTSSTAACASFSSTRSPKPAGTSPRSSPAAATPRRARHALHRPCRLPSPPGPDPRRLRRHRQPAPLPRPPRRRALRTRASRPLPQQPRRPAALFRRRPPQQLGARLVAPVIVAADRGRAPRPPTRDARRPMPPSVE